MSEEKARETKLIQARQQGFEPRCNCLVDNPRPGDLAKPDGEVTRRAFAKLAPATTEYRRKIPKRPTTSEGAARPILRVVQDKVGDPAETYQL